MMIFLLLLHTNNIRAIKCLLFLLYNCPLHREVLQSGHGKMLCTLHAKREANIQHTSREAKKYRNKIKKTIIWVMTSSESRYISSKYKQFSIFVPRRRKTARDVCTNQKQSMVRFPPKFSHAFHNHTRERRHQQIKKNSFSMVFFGSLFTFRCHHHHHHHRQIE